MLIRKRFRGIFIAVSIVALLAGYGMKEAQVTGTYDKANAQPTAFEKLAGICYGPARDGEDPNMGVMPTEQNLQEDIHLISQLADSIRTYGITGSLQKIPMFCEETGLNCYPGAWISSQKEYNNKEIQSLIQVGKQGLKSVKALVVGNEVLLRQELSERDLVAYIKEVKGKTSLPVSTAEPWYIWLEHHELAETVDVLLVHIYPYWDGIALENAAEYVFAKWRSVKESFPGKVVVIGETGWPTQGDRIGEAVPSEQNQKEFVSRFLMLNRTYDTEYFMFQVFDEKWKEKYEGPVGAHWGLYYSNGCIKPLLADADIVPEIAHKGINRANRSDRPS
jgi:exo-beta-1,3-glucanase (GH17 family)